MKTDDDSHHHFSAEGGRSRGRGNNKALPYEDPTLPAMERAKDLVGRLSLQQQVGLLLATNQRTGGVNTSDVSIPDYNWCVGVAGFPFSCLFVPSLSWQLIPSRLSRACLGNK
jgi:hypothetical protein